MTKERTIWDSRKALWNGIGTEIKKALSAEEALEMAELDWNVIQKDLFTEDGEKIEGFKANELSSPERAAEFARSLYYDFAENEVRCMPKECMIVCCVDTKCNPTIIEHVSVGTANSALVDVKSIFMSAILSNSDGIFIFHNHPSGSAEPSAQDNLITNKIREAGNLLDIKLLDHIIVGDSEYYSYDEKRLCVWREQYEKAC